MNQPIGDPAELTLAQLVAGIQRLAAEYHRRGRWAEAARQAVERAEAKPWTVGPQEPAAQRTGDRA